MCAVSVVHVQYVPRMLYYAMLTFLLPHFSHHPAVGMGHVKIAKDLLASMVDDSAEEAAADVLQMAQQVWNQQQQVATAEPAPASGASTVDLLIEAKKQTLLSRFGL